MPPPPAGDAYLKVFRTGPLPEIPASDGQRYPSIARQSSVLDDRADVEATIAVAATSSKAGGATWC